MAETMGAMFKGMAPKAQQPAVQGGATRSLQFTKTKMCPFELLGMCTKGIECPFAHGVKELNPLPDLRGTRLCKQFMKTGECPNGEECTFAHSKAELRQASTRLRVQQQAILSHTGAKETKKSPTVHCPSVEKVPLPRGLVFHSGSGTGSTGSTQASPPPTPPPGLAEVEPSPRSYEAYQGVDIIDVIRKMRGLEEPAYLDMSLPSVTDSLFLGVGPADWGTLPKFFKTDLWEDPLLLGLTCSDAEVPWIMSGPLRMGF